MSNEIQVINETTKVIKGIMTQDGIAKMDYESLVNLPTIDGTPTQGSTNAVQSGAVYTALAGKMNATNGVVTNPVFEWTGADGSKISFKQITSNGKTTFGFVHTAKNGAVTEYPFIETTSSGHTPLFAEATHKHDAGNINTGILSADRLPGIPSSKLETVSIEKGGTGATTAAAALTNLGLTASATELNILDGATVTTAELNVLDGITATTAELNYVDGVTSNIQTQLNNKATKAQGTKIDNLTTDVTAIKYVTALPSSPDSKTLYLIKK